MDKHSEVVVAPNLSLLSIPYPNKTFIFQNLTSFPKTLDHTICRSLSVYTVTPPDGSIRSHTNSEPEPYFTSSPDRKPLTYVI